MDSFSHSYLEARNKFLQAAGLAGLEVQTCLHPMTGPEGESLATDVVVIGDHNASRVLFVTSGVHGVEGYYGSGVLVQWLRNQIQAPEGIKIVLVHACNPYGFAWGRRFTEENVDLNRNFWDLSMADEPVEVNSSYEAIRQLVEYPACTPEAFVECQQQRQTYLATNGVRTLKVALSGGQEHSPEGLFYIGKQPTWARQTYENLVRQHSQGCQHLFFMDLHTGLGPRGYADFLHQYEDESTEHNNLLTYIGERILGDERDEATAQGLEGTTIACFNRIGATQGFSVLGGAIECGTLPLAQVLEALVQEMALHRHGCDDDELTAAIKQNLKDAFYVDAEDWKQQVYDQTCEIRDGALQYLCNR